MDIFLNQYQSLLGILIAAGLSYLVYMHLLRINNYFDMLKQYSNHLGATVTARTVIVKNRYFFDKETKEPLNNKDAAAVVDLLNFFIQLGMMYRLGLINRKLTLLTFGNSLRELKENDDLMKYTQESRSHLDYLINKFKKYVRRRKNIERISQMIYIRKAVEK